MTLLIPGLLDFSVDGGERDDIPAAPALGTILARADRLSVPGGCLEEQLFALFGVEAPEEGDFPVASVTRVLDLGVIDKGWWLRADPVHLRPERDRLILFDTQAVPLSQEEASRLAAEVSETYAADGWLLKAPRPGRWYLKPPRVPRITTTALPHVVGKDIHPYLPQGRDGKAWHTVLNEVQILLHTAAVNAERERRGELPINSLWFWGGGRLPSVAPVEWVQVSSEEPVSLALARLAQIRTSARPGTFAEWQRQASARGAHLVVLDQLRAAVQYGEREQWRIFVEQLERDWMAPLLSALRTQELAALTLYLGGGAYRLTAAQTRRWWRRRRPLSAYR
ncbi:MAG TPA: hypothetical protein VF203_10935 [Burkholderiales bacterium]